MNKYYVFMMLSDGFSPILKHKTDDLNLALALRKDLAIQDSNHEFVIFTPVDHKKPA